MKYSAEVNGIFALTPSLTISETYVIVVNKGFYSKSRSVLKIH